MYIKSLIFKWAHLESNQAPTVLQPVPNDKNQGQILQSIYSLISAPLETVKAL